MDRRRWGGINKQILQIHTIKLRRCLPTMGWSYDYTFDYFKEQTHQKSKNATCDKILGYIKRNPNVTIAELRKFIIDLKNNGF